VFPVSWLVQPAKTHDIQYSKVVPFIFHDSTTELTIDDSCVTAGGFEYGAREFSLMMVFGTAKHEV
jgi:hypothetical protein